MGVWGAGFGGLGPAWHARHGLPRRGKVRGFGGGEGVGMHARLHVEGIEAGDPQAALGRLIWRCSSTDQMSRLGRRSQPA